MYKALDLWLPAYLRRPAVPAVKGVTDILLCVCDHFEPLHHTDKAGALARLARWRKEFPALVKNFRDADGHHPRHTFFYPIEQYDPDLLAPLADLSCATGSEVEIHLHHDGDTPAGLAEKLDKGKTDLSRHGLLARDQAGRVNYGFIHGNWALANSHPAGRHCGVDGELGVLQASGCFADFTMPSAPSPTQARVINSLYYATDQSPPRPHDSGTPAKAGTHPEGLLLVQGPLGLNWQRRKFGFLPRIDNADLTGANPPRPDRMRLWMNLGIHVQGRPEWRFLKLHTHGAIPPNSRMLLGEPMRRFHEHLCDEWNDGKKFRLHYVTAREIVNIIHAAEDGQSGDAGQFRNYRYRPPAVLA